METGNIEQLMSVLIIGLKEKEKLKQYQVAEKMGCAPSELSQLLRGDRKWSSIWINKVLELCGLDIIKSLENKKSFLSHCLKIRPRPEQCKHLNMALEIFNSDDQKTAKALILNIEQFHEKVKERQPKSKHREAV